MIKRMCGMMLGALLIAAWGTNAASVDAGDPFAAFDVLEFGSRGKRNMLYDVRQRPPSVLLHGRLYIVYNGDAVATDNDRGAAYPMFISYDPEARTFTEPIRIGPKSTDHHFSPIIWADEADFLHVLHGCHKTPGTHLVSAQPVTEKTTEVVWHPGNRMAPKLSYPTVYRIHEDKEVIAYRTDGHTSSWTYRISDDNGRTWVGPDQDVTDLDRKGRIDWSSYRTVLPSRDGKSLHMVYTDYDDDKTQRTPDRLYNPRYDQRVDNGWKYNLHYVRIDLETGDVVNADGQVLRTPIDIDYSKENCLIWNTEWRGSGIPPGVALDKNGEPTFLHMVSGENLRTHHYYYVRRERGQWRQTKICGSNHNWNGGYLTHGSNGVVRAYLITGEGYLEGGYMHNRGGGRIEEWVSTDGGDRWTRIRDLTPDPVQYPGWRFNNIQPVNHPDGTGVDGMLLCYGWKDENAPTAKAFLLHAKTGVH